MRSSPDDKRHHRRGAVVVVASRTLASVRLLDDDSSRDARALRNLRVRAKRLLRGDEIDARASNLRLGRAAAATEESNSTVRAESRAIAGGVPTRAVRVHAEPRRVRRRATRAEVPERQRGTAEVQIPRGTGGGLGRTRELARLKKVTRARLFHTKVGSVGDANRHVRVRRAASATRRVFRLQRHVVRLRETVQIREGGALAYFSAERRGERGRDGLAAQRRRAKVSQRANREATRRPGRLATFRGRFAFTFGGGLFVFRLGDEERREGRRERDAGGVRVHHRPRRRLGALAKDAAREHRDRRPRE